jgi:acyl-CoA reductase-like NAD-dependent aldehyde dehydrogenase
MATTQQLYIAGRWCDAQSGRIAEVSNAFSGEVVTAQAAAGVADVDAAVRAAAAAFAEWSAAAGRRCRRAERPRGGDRDRGQ